MSYRTRALSGSLVALLVSATVVAVSAVASSGSPASTQPAPAAAAAPAALPAIAPPTFRIHPGPEPGTICLRVTSGIFQLEGADSSCAPAAQIREWGMLTATPLPDGRVTAWGIAPEGRPSVSVNGRSARVNGDRAFFEVTVDPSSEARVIFAGPAGAREIVLPTR